MRTFRLFLIAALILCNVAPAEAGIFCRRRARRCRPVACVRTAYVPRSAPAPQAPAYRQLDAPRAYAGPVGNALDAVNRIRARYGRGPLAYDAGLAATASMNSAAGFGHNGFYRSWEAVSMNTSTPDQAVAVWLGSPAHLNVMLAGNYGALVIVNGVATLDVR